MPEGMRGAKPSSKAGWTLTTQRRPHRDLYDSHGKRVTDELAEARWTANGEANHLQDAWYDEFVLRITLPAEPRGVGLCGAPGLHPGRVELGRMAYGGQPSPRGASGAAAGQAGDCCIGQPRPLKFKPSAASGRQPRLAA